MRKLTVSRMRERYAQTVLTFRITYVYTNTHYSQYRNPGRANDNKQGRAVNVSYKGNLSACFVGHACHRFVSPVSDSGGQPEVETEVEVGEEKI